MVERLLHTQHFKVWLLLVIYDQHHRQQQHWDMYDVVVVGNIHIYMFISYITNNNNILKCCVCSHLSTIVLRWSRSQCNWQMANFYDRTIVCQCSLLYGFTCVIKKLICDQLNALIMWKTYELIEESTYFVMIPIWDMWDDKLAEIQRVINCYYGRKTLYVSLSWVSGNVQCTHRSTFKQLNIPKCNTQLCKLMYLFTNGTLPCPLQKVFTRNSNVHSYQTRQAHDPQSFYL